MASALAWTLLWGVAAGVYYGGPRNFIRADGTPLHQSAGTGLIAP